jgi:hypothetical protein
MMRAAGAVWGAAVIAVAWLAALSGLVPRWVPAAVTGVAALGVWGWWLILTPRGAHADRARLSLVPDDRIGSMDYDAELDWLARTGQLPPPAYDAERAWREKYGITADDGGWASGSCANELTEVWPNHDAPGWSPSDAGAGSPLDAPNPPGAVLPAPVPPPVPPAPADGDAGGAGPGSADLFLAPMASDALRFMLDMDADVQLFIDRLREGCAAYVAGMREAL